jgi:hypothetical protein
MIAVPSSAAWRIASRMTRVPCGSRPVSGSSSSSTRGRWISAQQIASFCRIPRESAPHSSSRFSSRSKRARSWSGSTPSRTS